MGYHTDFTGWFECEPPLNADQVAYLQAFNNTRRVRRNEQIALSLEDPLREAVELPIGLEGAFFVGSANGSDKYGQKPDASVIDNNRPPGSTGWRTTLKGEDGEPHPQAQPELWCQWKPTDDGTGIEWNQSEKFYEYVQWIAYLMRNFLKPWGIKLTGHVDWQGEDASDHGRIRADGEHIFVSDTQPVYTSYVEVPT